MMRIRWTVCFIFPIGEHPQESYVVSTVDTTVVNTIDPFPLLYVPVPDSCLIVRPNPSSVVFATRPTALLVGFV